MSYISQRGATGGLALTANGQFQQYTPQVVPAGYTDNAFLNQLGSRWDLEDGREVVLVLAGATNLAEGLLMQDAPLVAGNLGLSATAFTAYSNNGDQPAVITVTNGATAIAANQYQLGYVAVISGTGAGQTLQIAANQAAAASASFTVTLADGPNTALDATSVIDLIPQPGNSVVVNPVAPTNVPRGVTLYPITAGNYGFLLSKGTVAVRSDASPASAGNSISPSTTTAGDVTIFATATGVIGKAIVAGTSGSYKPVVLDL